MRNIRFNLALEEVQMIRKDRLSEREFYHRIVEAISRMGDTEEISEEEVLKLQNALREKGCVTYNEYAEQKRKEGIIVPDKLNLDSGDIHSAAALVGQLLGEPDSAMFAIPFMNEGNQHSYTYRWLQASRKRINVGEYFTKKNEDLRAFRALGDNGDTIQEL